MADVLHYIRIKARPDRVYAALTTPEGIHGWWTGDAQLDDHVGGEGVFRFSGAQHLTRVRIDRLDPDRGVGWTPVESNATGGWVGTTIAFDLEPDGEDTLVRFSHRGYAQPDDGYRIVSTAWAWYLMSLKALVETGKGAPHPAKPFVIGG
jgi:uncharacterized protein YndB with AHSA1/START domain